MATQGEADRTLAAFGDILVSHPNVGYASVELRNGNWVLVLGVFDLNLAEMASALAVDEMPGGPEPLPRSLPIPSDDGPMIFSSASPQIEVLWEPTDSIVAQWTDFHRPAEGGDSIGNARVGGAGTLGATVTISTRPNKLFLITNWHVLVGGGGSNGDAILQQSAYDGGLAPAAWIADLSWSALTARVDLAIAEVRNSSLVSVGTVRTIGRVAGIRSPSAGASVKKGGRTTNVTTGSIQSTNATVSVSGYPGGARTFTNQIMTTDMSRPGDSGSLLLDSQNYMVGLVFAGNSSTRSFANRADDVQNALGSSLNSNGSFSLSFA
ncbi:trypsin-like peptidase domain-containing protein [Hyphomonas sp.]|uniref:trypsin-like peptidase domain-containing protein n=1 Tax=Hyphomonas sp. TaxID=87 RepID=UPI0025BA3B1F|nr:trypsin-like peptidase domain-containing protein [Hyphomonas sp.]